jgi:hypothetical protein
MSIDRLSMAEGRIERLQNALSALAQQVAALSQTQWQMAGRMPAGGGAGLIRAVLTASLSSGGTPGTPVSAAGTILVPDGSGGWTATGGTSATIYSEFNQGITVSGSKFCWVILDSTDNKYYLVVADC